MATLAQNGNNEDNQQPPTTGGGSVIQPSFSGQPNSTQQFNQNQQAQPQQRQIGSGNFTNIQQYLGANKQAGQQLGQNLQKGIGQKFGQAMATSGRELNEAQQQQQQTGNLYNQGFQQYQQLGGTQNVGNLTAQPVQNAVQQQQYSFATPQGNNAAKGVTAQEYNANIGSRQQASKDIAADQNKLNQFTGLRSGTAQQEQEKLVKEQTQQARQAAEAVKQQHEQRMRQLATETGRSGLLGEFVGGRDYAGAKKSLDLAFLQKDPNRAIDTLKRNIGAKESDVRSGLSNVSSAEQQEQLLRTQGQDLSQRLGEQTKTNVQDYVNNLQSRISVMENQRGQKMDWARKQLEDFQAGKPLNEEFLNLLGVKKGTQLFNVPQNLKDVNEFLNAEDFSKKNLNLQDVTNQQDIANYQALAQLAGLSPSEYAIQNASTLKDIQQYGSDDARTISNRAQQAKQDFIKNMASTVARGDTGWVGGVKGSGLTNMLDYLVNPEYYKNAGVRYQMRGGDEFGADARNIAEQGKQLYNLLNPVSAVNPLDGGNMLANAAGNTIDRVVNAYNSSGGDLERAAQVGNAISTGLGSSIPGPIGNFSSDLGNAVSGVISNLGSAFGGGDEGPGKSMGYVRRRTVGYGDEGTFEGGPVADAIRSILASQGFTRYMGEQGTQTATDPLSELAKNFGYRTDSQGSTGVYAPALDKKQLLNNLLQDGELEKFPTVT